MPANNALLDGIKLKLDADLLKISAKLQMNKECVSLAIQDMTWSIMFVSFHHQILKDHLMLAAEPELVFPRTYTCSYMRKKAYFLMKYLTFYHIYAHTCEYKGLLHISHHM